MDIERIRELFLALRQNSETVPAHLKLHLRKDVIRAGGNNPSVPTGLTDPLRMKL